MWSIQPLSLLKPACSSRSLRSPTIDRGFLRTFARILLGTDNSVMPRQFLYSDRAPFFGILMMMPWLQSSGIFFLFHLVSNSGYRMPAVVTASALNNSALRRSLPSALWFFRDLMAAMISSCLGGPVSMLRSSSASGISDPSSGAGLLRTSSKCSTHRAFWSSSEVRSCPCLSRMETRVCKGAPDPAFPLLSHENPTSRTFSLVSRISFFPFQKEKH